MKKLLFFIFSLVVCFGCIKERDIDESSLTINNSVHFTKLYHNTLWLSKVYPRYVKFNDDYILQFGYAYPLDSNFELDSINVSLCNIVREGNYVDLEFINGEIEFEVTISENDRDLLSFEYKDKNNKEHSTVIKFEFDNNLQLLKQTYQCLFNGIPYGYVTEPEYYEQAPLDTYVTKNCSQNEYEGC